MKLRYYVVLLPLLICAQNCPPDTLAVTPPQDNWDIEYWNNWEGLEVVSWNLEHFPSSGSTVNSVAEIILDQAADIYAFQEIDDTLTFINQLMPLLPNYDYQIGSNGYLAFLAVIYRNEVLSLNEVEELWANSNYYDDHDDNYYNNARYYFASRPPLRLGLTWQCGNRELDFDLIDIHFKCCDEGFERRQIASLLMRDYLVQRQAAGDTNIIVLGDYNDDLDDPDNDNSLLNLLNEDSMYFVNLDLTADPTDYYDSYPSWPSFLDHILITSGLFQFIDEGEATTFRHDDNIMGYLADISDHRPVGWRFETPAPAVTSPYPIIIVEILANPAAVSDTDGEWFEIYNPGDSQVELSAWVIADADGDQHSIDPGIDFFAIDPGKHMVFGRNGDSLVNGGYQADYEYAGFALANTSDEIILYDSQGRLVDEVYYDSNYPQSSGTAMYLADYDLDNNLAENWQAATRPFGSGDLGSPGYGADDSLSVVGGNYPLEVTLLSNYPNPFNSQTTISFDLAESGFVQLMIFDLIGRQVDLLLDEYTVAGEHIVTWHPDGLASGIYLVRISGDEVKFSASRKILFLK